MNNAFRNEQIIEWEKMIRDLFYEDVPNSRVWSNLDEIVEVLNFIGEAKRAENHTFLPDRGGLDLAGCSLSNEQHCIELDLGSFKRILKPKKLTFQILNDNFECAYFFLEADNLNITGNGSDVIYNRQELVEVSPGNYISRIHWESDEYNGRKLPEEARLVGRYFKSGSFAIFSKASEYNLTKGTYDGRHGDLTASDFKKYIQEVFQIEKRSN